MYLTKYLSFYPLRSRDELLAVNALSGAVDLFEKKVVTSLKPGNELSERVLDVEICRKMVERGYFFASPGEEEVALRKVFQLWRKREKGKSQFILCPTYNCNLRCVYCFEQGVPRRKYGNLRLGDIRHIFKIIETLRDRDQEVTVHLFGGEPLLPSTRPLVEEVFHLSEARNYKTIIITNGINIRGYRSLLQRYRHLIRYVQTTVDGPREIHNKRRVSPSSKLDPFQMTTVGIELLLHADIKVNLRVNLDRENISALPELASYIKTRGWHENANFICNLVPVSDHSGDSTFTYLMPEDEITLTLSQMLHTQEDLRTIFHLSTFRILNHLASVLGIEGAKETAPRFYYCEACNLESYVFGPDGYLYACPEAIANPQYAIGRFKPRFEIFEERASMWGNRNILNIEKCLNCDIATLCGGGCAYAALKINGSIYEPVCNRAKEVIANYVYAVSDRIAPL